MNKPNIIAIMCFGVVMAIMAWFAYHSQPVDYNKVPRYAPNSTQHRMSLPCPPVCEQDVNTIAKEQDKNLPVLIQTKMQP